MAHVVAEQHLSLAVVDRDAKLSVRRFSVREGLSKLFSIQVIANSPNANLDLEKIVGQAALFQVAGGQLHAQFGARRWTGICVHAEQLHADPEGESTYFLHIAPTLWLTTQRRETRIFQHQKVPEIIKQLLDEWGIDALSELNGYYRKHEMVVQYDETDYDFMCRLMQWAGISYYFKFEGSAGDGWQDGTKTEKPVEKGVVRRALAWANPFSRRDPKQEAEQKEREERDKARRAAESPDALRCGWTTVNDAGDKHDDSSEQAEPLSAVPLKLALSDGVHENEPRKLPIHYVDEPNEAAQEEFATQLRIKHNIAPGRFTVRDFDFRAKLDLPLLATEEKAAPKPEDFYEQYHYVPGAFKARGEGALPLADAPHPYRHLQKEIGGELAERGFHSVRVAKRVVRFVTNCLDLGPGMVCSFNHHPRADLGNDKRLLITGFNLEGVVNDKWVYQAEAVFADVPYWPALETPKPRAVGVQSAVVTGPPGQEIHVDELGRVKVQFLWDRDGKFDDKSSCWLRVSQDWAGPGFGAVMLPRVGQEVLVGFMEGDPDLPVVVGRVYNAINRVPYALPEHRTRSTLKSDSSPEADGFSELMLEDKAGEELFYVQAETDLQKLVKQYETDRVGRDHMSLVGESRSMVTAKLDATLVGDRYLLRTIKTPNTAHDDVGKPQDGDELKLLRQDQPDIGVLDTALEMKSKRIIFTTGKATVAFDDKDLRIEASGNISIKAVGADCIIEGKKVHLNPGSAPAAAPKPEPFALPAHGIFKGHAADPRKEMAQRMARAALETVDYTPPSVPGYAPAPPDELKRCELVATLVHCMHPKSPREPCQDERRDDFHVLEVVPDYPERPDRAAMFGGFGRKGAAAGNWPTALARAEDDDPRPRLAIWGKEDAEGKFVLVNDDVVTLKAQVHDKCDKHTSWTIVGKPSGTENKVGESSFTAIKGWLYHPWRAQIDFTTNDITSAVNNYRGALGRGSQELYKLEGWHEAKAEMDQAKRALEAAPAGSDTTALQHDFDSASHNFEQSDSIVKSMKQEKFALPLQAQVKGFSWAAKAPPRRVNITASACSGAPHKYTVLSYPNDKLSIEFGFGLKNLGFWEAFNATKFGVFQEMSRGKVSLVFDSNIYIGGTAQWKENPADHRAFYHYDLKLRGSPFIGGKAGGEVHLYHIAKLFNPPLGILLWALDKLLGAAVKVEVGGSITGELSFGRSGPDNLKGDWSGKAGGSATAKVSVDVWLLSKEMCGTGASGSTTLTMNIKPKADRSPVDPPQASVDWAWDPAVVEIYFGIKTMRKAQSKKLFKQRTWGPKTVNLVPGNKLRGWLGIDEL